jgi:Lrp/AsnC family leucine-responsive transcriptional regulator
MENQINLDETDLHILRLLSENSKLGNKEIAARVGLTVTPTFERIRRLERKGVIKGYTTRIDPKALGKGMIIFCQVSLKTHNTDILHYFECQVQEFPEVSDIYYVAGNYDYLLKVEISGIDRFQDFLKNSLASIPHIANVQSNFVLNVVKDQIIT